MQQRVLIASCLTGSGQTPHLSFSGRHFRFFLYDISGNWGILDFNTTLVNGVLHMNADSCGDYELRYLESGAPLCPQLSYWSATIGPDADGSPALGADGTLYITST